MAAILAAEKFVWKNVMTSASASLANLKLQQSVTLDALKPIAFRRSIFLSRDAITSKNLIAVVLCAEEMHDKAKRMKKNLIFQPVSNLL